MKEEFIKQREEESYNDETMELYYNHLLLISEDEDDTEKVINIIKQDENGEGN